MRHDGTARHDPLATPEASTADTHSDVEMLDGKAKAGPGSSAGTPMKPLDSIFVLRAASSHGRLRSSSGQPLLPRRVFPKEALALPAGRKLRLFVKLADDLHARPMADGRLAIDGDAAVRVTALSEVVAADRIKFVRAHSIDDQTLSTLERRAADNTQSMQPDMAGFVEAILRDPSRETAVMAARRLHSLPEVEYVELESTDLPPPPPAADIAPTTPLLVGNQSYRGAATGIDVDHVWERYGVRGHSSLRVTDCEYQFNTTHEDLAGLAQVQPGISTMYSAFGDDHGTAVMGLLFAGHNGYGMSGSVPDCPAWFYPEFSTLTSGGTQSRAACVTAAIAASQPGDIVVLEMQVSGVTSGVYVPAEYSLSVFNAVKTGADAGVITVAAAGNGGENLDNADYAAYRARGDSGGIIVGAGNSARARQSYSTHGARVNVQGWGSGVATTGYGTLATYGGDANQKYASGFSGTSSATPIAASAAALLQSVAIEICETRLSPAEMRNLLVSTGRAQTGDVSKPIGPLPNLRDAVAALLAAHPPVFSTLRSWSVFHFGQTAAAPGDDPDKDGLCNLLEYATGSDPNQPDAAEGKSIPRLTREDHSGAASYVFEFENPPDRSAVAWQVQRSTSLAPGSWSDLVPGEDGVSLSRSGASCRVTIPVPPTPPATVFFRLAVTAN